MLRKYWRILLAMGLCLPVMLALPGCEDEPSSADVSSYLNDDPFNDPERDQPPDTNPRGLSISPAVAVVTNDNETLLLSAKGGHKPYDWRVDDPSVGDVHGSTDSAVYTRFRPGNNLVKLSDSRGQWTYCTISQPEGDAVVTPLAISPTLATVSTNGGVAVFTASGGVPGYSWSVLNIPRGTIKDTGPTSAVYERDASGDNVVVLTDNAGSKVYAIVKQP